ncbi:MAG: response regulator transcription factor [Luteolibacter sp.]
MPTPIRLILIDDHPVIRAGVASLLSLYAEFEIISQGSNAAQAMSLYGEHLPDLMLMDVRLQGMDGIQALTAIRAVHPQARVVMLSSEALPADLSRAMEAGACGYLLKTSSHAFLARELRHAHQHGWCHPFTPEARSVPKDTNLRLTARELEVLNCLRRGLSNTDIGIALGISPETAITHVKSLLVKMNAANRTEAVSLGYEIGLLRTQNGKDTPA